jgi:hypothetical protein
MAEGTMDLNDRRRADHQLAKDSDEARAEYVRQAEIEAIADAEYARIRSATYLECRDQGMPVTGADLVAKAAGSEIKQRRDIAESLKRAALLKIAECDRRRVTVRDIHSTSERIDGLAA